jgi:hypothetical protein
MAEDQKNRFSPRIALNSAVPVTDSVHNSRKTFYSIHRVTSFIFIYLFLVYITTLKVSQPVSYKPLP